MNIIEKVKGLTWADIPIFIAKYLIGWWYIYLVVWARGYARSVVYNYVLQHDKRKWLGRLWQRKPTNYFKHGLRYGWNLRGIHNTGLSGIVNLRYVSKLEFYLVVFFIWGWLDDDANEDTTDIGYCNTISVGPTGYRTNGVDRTHDLVGRLYGKLLPIYKKGDVIFGNAFDLGDVRAHYPYFKFWPCWVWNNRNTAMNFQYLFTNY